MGTTLTAIELRGTVNERHQLQLDDIIPISGPKRVRVIVLYSSDNECDEHEWLQAGAQNPAFDYLHDPEEDIYSVHDGKPINNKK
ncbi:vWA domain-containing protein [Methanospirillum lacunae]|uniref:Uncharacterized protein n=1 Tax=Methanospirillum lacunae TaxID=668570 RepID=A0A2V2N803_9EURY|nr:hypothetical protein [Methanospirillum lacunae]PWR71701.1 hypothetical protein DK846_12725 [Methanospirillum lacunae]